MRAFILMFIFILSIFRVSANGWIELNGNSSYINLSDNIPDFYQGEFTISLWINPKKVDNNVLPRLFEKGAGFIAIMGDASNSRYSKIAIELLNETGENTVEFWSGDKILINAWQNVIIVYHGLDGEWYINGNKSFTTKLEIKGNWTGKEKNSGNADLLLGKRRQDNLRDFNGEIDEFRIYNRNLSLNKIKEIYNSGRNKNASLESEGLIAWLAFDEGSGVNTGNLINGFNASLVNAVWHSNFSENLENETCTNCTFSPLFNDSADSSEYREENDFIRNLDESYQNDNYSNSSNSDNYSYDEERKVDNNDEKINNFSKENTALEQKNTVSGYAVKIFSASRRIGLLDMLVFFILLYLAIKTYFFVKEKNRKTRDSIVNYADKTV